MSKISYPPGTAGGGGAPDTAQYLVLTLDAALSAERRLILAEGLAAADGGANGDYSISIASRVVDRDVTSVDITVSTTVTIYTYIVPSSQLGTTKAIRFTLAGDLLCSVAASGSFSVIIAFGATTMYSDGGTLVVGAGRRPWSFDMLLAAENSASAQILSGVFVLGTAGGATTGIGDMATDEIQSLTPLFGTATEASAGSLTFAVIVKMSTAGASSSWRMRVGYAELL